MCVNASQQRHTPHADRREVLLAGRNKGRAAALFHILVQMELRRGRYVIARKHRQLCASVCVCVRALVGLCEYLRGNTYTHE